MGNTILAKGGNHILAKRDNSAWPKGSKLSGFSNRHILCDWHTVFLPAFQCENDVSFDIHNWVCLKIDTPKYTQKVRYAKILRDILFSVYFVITW